MYKMYEKPGAITSRVSSDRKGEEPKEEARAALSLEDEEESDEGAGTSW